MDSEATEDILNNLKTYNRRHIIQIINSADVRNNYKNQRISK